jgi:tetratricopeptide (TPR) repeat protein
LNSATIEAAKIAYSNGNYLDAHKSYYAGLKEGGASFAPGDSATIYYRIGNCLLKMHNFNEAAAAYQKAIEDVSFPNKAAAQVNLGKSLLGLGRFEDAIASFNVALADVNYAKAYQAQLGLGNAYTKLGMVVEAGNAYRNAALDERNPNPTKALIALGNCFMALGRPLDAIESYKAIFGFTPTPGIQHKTYENLGQAYTSVERYSEAADAFAKALKDGDFSLSEAAQADYAKALQALGTEGHGAGMAPVQNDDPFAFLLSDQQAGVPSNEPSMQPDGTIAYGAGNVPKASDTDFFDVTEADLVEMSKMQMKGERKLRHTGLKIVLTVVIILILVLGLGAFGFTQGYGFPSQEQVVNDVFVAHAQGSDTTPYWIGTSTEEKEAVVRIMDMVGITSSIDIIFTDKAMTRSEVVVAAHLTQGGTLYYDINLERAGLGWKISALNLYFPSK